ncbi:hypothetical protein SCLCIDRAFT_777105 [Scleroderma citrinum Foug A]|uniref:Uncharacterized protein n=1 Tax=Scleroderma citrinum Foug A TaxID=1036808 RepID=A0A0C3DQ93_9AGAM|nr:hypothetical protein SCLCIDRAFT_777105 [Scleroderma citrinum Foug A]
MSVLLHFPCWRDKQGDSLFLLQPSKAHRNAVDSAAEDSCLSTKSNIVDNGGSIWTRLCGRRRHFESNFCHRHYCWWTFTRARACGAMASDVLSLTT